MAELKDRQQIILLHGAGEFTSAKATELELVKGELVIEHGTDDVKLHTLDNSGNLATIISEKAVDAKIAVVTDAQTLVDNAQNDRLDAIETAMGDWTAATQAEKDAAQDKAIIDGDAATLVSAKEYTDNLSITYDSDAKEIKLMSGETQIGTAIDATDFIKDGMVSNAELVAGEGDEEGKMFIEITFNSDAESDPIRIDVSSLIDAGAIAELEERVKANEDAIDAIETAMGDWTAATQAEKDAAQDDAIEALQGKEGDTKDSVSIVGAKLYTDEKIQEVRNTLAGVDGRVTANETILAGYGTGEGKTADVKTDIANLQGQITAIVEDTAYLKEVEVVDPNNSIVVTPSDNKVTIDFTKLVINGGEY